MAMPRLLEISRRCPGSAVATIAAAVALAAFVLADALGVDLLDGPVAYRELTIVRYLEQVTVPVAELGRVGRAERAAVAGPS
jgi:hypothetical protein